MTKSVYTKCKSTNLFFFAAYLFAELEQSLYIGGMFAVVLSTDLKQTLLLWYGQLLTLGFVALLRLIFIELRVKLNENTASSLIQQSFYSSFCLKYRLFRF